MADFCFCFPTSHYILAKSVRTASIRIRIRFIAMKGFAPTRNLSRKGFLIQPMFLSHFVVKCAYISKLSWVKAIIIYQNNQTRNATNISVSVCWC